MGRAHLSLLYFQRLTNCVKEYFPILNERSQNSRAWDSGAKWNCPREAPVSFQPSFAGSLFHCFMFLFVSIDWWIYPTKYQNPLMTHLMYFLFSLIFTWSFIFPCSVYLLFNFYISVFLSWYPSLLATLF